MLPENDRTKLDSLLKKVDDSLTEETKMVQTIRNIFPTLSQESAEKFVRKANDRKLTDEEFLAWANELAAKGEVFLSDSQMEEMASLWWKAVGKLPEEQQDFIQSMATKMRLGQQLTLEENELVSTCVAYGLTLFNQEDKERYFYLRSEALEEALKRVSGTINVKDYIKDKFPSVFSLYLSSLDDLDSYEKEFIDLLEKLPEEEQDYYAKKVYEYGFYREILEIVKEGKPIAVYSDAYDKAVNLMEKREYEKALPYLEIAIKTDISYLKALAYYNIGYCYDELGNFSKSVEAYKQVIRINPNNNEAHNNLGIAYGELGLYKDAIESFKQAIRIDPDDDVNHYNLGYAYGELGNYTKAIEFYKQAIRINPDYVGAYCNLGIAYYELGFYKDAMEAYKQAIRIDPDDAVTHYNLGVSYYELGFYKDAIEAYKQAIHIAPEYATAHNNLGNSYVLIGDRNLALNEYKILKELDINLANELFDFINK